MSDPTNCSLPPQLKWSKINDNVCYGARDHCLKDCDSHIWMGVGERVEYAETNIGCG